MTREEILDELAILLERFDNGMGWRDGNYVEALEMAVEALGEEKTGKWVGGEWGHCSCCGHEGCASDIWNTGKINFCPNCGARMVEE